jgi:hypothetical protein
VLLRRFGFVAAGTLGCALITGLMVGATFHLADPRVRHLPLPTVLAGVAFFATVAAVFTLPAGVVGAVTCAVLIRLGAETSTRRWLAIGLGAGLVLGLVVAAFFIVSMDVKRDGRPLFLSAGSLAGTGSGLFLALLGRRTAHLWRPPGVRSYVNPGNNRGLA